MHTAVTIALVALTGLLANAASAQSLERLPSGATLVTQLLQLSGKFGDLQSRATREVTASPVSYTHLQGPIHQLRHCETKSP